MTVFRRILMSGIIDLPESQIFRYKADSKINTYNRTCFNGKMVYHKYNPETGEGEIGNSEDIINIKNRAFTGGYIKEAYIPEKCEIIDSGVFAGIDKIYLNENLKELKDTFSTGTSLLEIHITNLEAFFNLNYSISRNNNVYLNDEKITNLIVPESITTIKGYTFRYCEDLESIVIGDNVKKIETYSFYSCPNLTNVVLGNGIEEIESWVFHHCDKLPVYNNGVYADTLLVSCSGNVEDIKEGTKFIGWCAFDNYGSYVKYEEIILPNSIISVGTAAFNYHDINKLVIPDSVQYLASRAFDKVKEIEIGSGLKKIYGDSIKVHNGLEKITISNNNTIFNSGNNYDAIIETATNTLIIGTNNTTIPDNIKHIGDYAFYECNLINDEVIIPDGVVTIGDYVFFKSNIYSIEIPNSTISIGQECFRDCNKLLSVVLGNGIDSIGDFAFESTYKLREIKCYNKKAPTVGTNCFNDYRGGISPTLFYPYGSDYSSWLTNNIFYNNLLYRTACLDENLHNYELDGWDLAVIVLSNGENTKLFNDNVIGISNVQVDNINIGSTLSTYNFNDVNKEHLVRFNFEDSKIPNEIFKDLNVVSCKIKEGITEIGIKAFNTTPYILNVCNLPNSLTIINDEAFNRCKIVHLNCPNIEYIGYYSINSEFLKTIQLSDKTTTVGALAFINSTSLYKVVLGANVKEVGREAFAGCSSLTDITFVSENIEFGLDVFKDCDSLPTYKGASYADTYLVRQFYGWDTMELKEGTKYIGTGAFDHCAIKGDIYLPDSVTHIYSHSLTYIKNAYEVRLGKNTKYVGDHAFPSAITKITCEADIAPTISFTTFNNLTNTGKLYYPKGSDYSSWLSSEEYYLGYHNWTGVETEFE